MMLNQIDTPQPSRVSLASWLGADYDNLPAIAKEMVQVMGDEAAFALISEMGGRRLVVPGWPLQRASTRFQALEDIVGGDAARAFAERWGNIEVQIPMAAKVVRRMRIRGVIEAYSRGSKVPDLAAKHRVTESTIWKWLKTPLPPAQGSATTPQGENQ